MTLSSLIQIIPSPSMNRATFIGNAPKAVTWKQPLQDNAVDSRRYFCIVYCSPSCDRVAEFRLPAQMRLTHSHRYRSVGQLTHWCAARGALLRCMLLDRGIVPTKELYCRIRYKGGLRRVFRFSIFNLNVASILTIIRYRNKRGRQYKTLPASL